MTYKEFYGSDYDTFKNVLDKVLNTIHSSALACIQYTTFRIKSPESVMKKIGNEYSLILLAFASFARLWMKSMK